MVKLTKLQSGSYRARVNIGGGKYKSFTGKNKKEVQLLAAQFEAEIEGQRNGDSADMTVAEAVKRYIDSKKNVISPTTYRSYVRMSEYLFPSILSTQLRALSRQQIQAAVNDCAAENSPKTVRNKYGLLSSALKMFYPSFQPNITLPQKVKRSVSIPTEEDMISLLEYTHGTDIELPVLLAALCGMRASEITGLRWSAVDFERQLIRIDTAKVWDNNNRYVLKGTKSVAGQRTIKMLPHVCEAMREAYNEKDEFITELSSDKIYRRYKKALAECCPGKNYTFHELRHYAASVMIMLGIPVKYIADYLGHETEDMVNRVYGHIMKDKTDAMFARVEAYYTGVIGKCDFAKPK